jgi:anti-sigma factor RsiW
LILARVDGCLGADDERWLDDHVRQCDACRAEANSQAAVRSLLASRPALGVSAGFVDRVIERIEPAVGLLGVADWRKWTWRLSPVAAVLMLAALLVPARQTAAPASAQAASEVNLTSVMETWAGGKNTSLPVTALFWQQNVSNDSLLTALLASSPDATIERENREP